MDAVTRRYANIGIIVIAVSSLWLPAHVSVTLAILALTSAVLDHRN